MKIGQPADKPSTPGVATGRAAPAAPAGAGPAAPGGLESSAKVALSTTASTLIAKQKAVNPEFDAEKVEAVSQAINNNTYKVNAEVIADKLIANAQELLGKVAK